MATPDQDRRNLKRRSSSFSDEPQAKYPNTDRELFPTKHLVLVVPGIGQAMKKDSNHSEKIEKKLEKTLNGSKLKNEKIEFLAVDWRNGLTLDDGAAERLSHVDGVPGMRKMLNLALCDVLYYLSPEYCTQIINQLVKVLNERYEQYQKDHLDFQRQNGRVSILAHSLGSVITYDALTAKSPDFEMRGAAPTPNQHLKFKVDNFFAIGSPLGLFLSMRGLAQPAACLHQQGSGAGGKTLKLFSLDADTVCGHMYNIFHPYDVIAYRWEPLEWKDVKKPVKLRSSDETDSGGKRYDFALKKSALDRLKSAIPWKEMEEMAKTTKAHKCYWELKEVMEFILDRLAK